MSTDETAKSGRDLVREHLIERLVEAGMVRRKGTPAAVHEAAQKRMVERLSYMTADNLETLAETLIQTAPDGVWPGEVVWWTRACALQKPPATESRIVHSWLASVSGPEAEAGGYLVELYRFLLARHVPPGPVDYRRIRDEAAENARRAEIIRDRIARGAANAGDARWLEDYQADGRAAAGIVASGRAKREEVQ